MKIHETTHANTSKLIYIYIYIYTILNEQNKGNGGWINQSYLQFSLLGKIVMAYDLINTYYTNR